MSITCPSARGRWRPHARVAAGRERRIRNRLTLNIGSALLASITVGKKEHPRCRRRPGHSREDDGFRPIHAVVPYADTVVTADQDGAQADGEVNVAPPVDPPGVAGPGFPELAVGPQRPEHATAR